MSSERNVGLELMRLVMMFGIVVMHAAVQCAYPQAGLHWTLLDWCVCGFVFMSGYFGVRFNVRKCLNLVALGIWCAIVSNMVAGKSVLNSLKGVCGYWFLWSYLLLMMFVPIIDASLDGKNRRKILVLSAPVLFAVYGWGVMCAVPYVRDYIPQPRGLGGCTFLSLIGIYILVRIFREINLGHYCTARNAILLLPLCIALMYVGFWWYWWIPSFIVTCFVFEFFRRLKVPMFIARIVMFLSPSAFAIYLLHITSGGLTLISRMQVFLVESGCGIQLVFLLTALVTFSICLVIDIIRRLILSGMSCALKQFRGYF